MDIFFLKRPLNKKDGLNLINNLECYTFQLIARKHLVSFFFICEGSKYFFDQFVQIYRTHNAMMRLERSGKNFAAIRNTFVTDWTTKKGSTTTPSNRAYRVSLNPVLAIYPYLSYLRRLCSRTFGSNTVKVRSRKESRAWSRPWGGVAAGSRDGSMADGGWWIILGVQRHR